MYRIRSSSGEEAVFKTLEEFNAAVRSGIITADDEIFHMRANKWLDVKTHPHYRSALGWSDEPNQPAPAAPAPRLTPPANAKPSLSPFGVQTPVAAPPKVPRMQTPIRTPLTASAPRPAVGAAGVRPMVTQARPALNGQAAPPVAATPVKPVPAAPVVKPKRTSEILFLDVEDQPKPKPAAVQGAPAKAPEAPVQPDEFLIADDGIDTPVRTSSGHRMITDDVPPLDALPGPSPEDKAAKNGSSSQLWTPTLERDPFGPLSPHDVVPNSGPRHAVDLGIEAPLVEPVSSPPPQPEKSKTGMIIGGAGLVALLAVVALAWKPWAPSPQVAAGEPTPTTQQADSHPVSGAAAGSTALVQTVSAQTGPAAAKPAPGTSVPNALPGSDKSIPVKPDSAAPQETIVAAVKPDFRSSAMDLSAPSVEVSLNSGNTGVAPSELTRRYASAANAAKQDLYAKLMSAGFIRIFSASRLSTFDGISSARTSWEAGGDAITQYRTRITRIEKAYDDSVLASQRSGKWPAEEMRAWAGRASFLEPSETAQASDLMFKQVSGLLELLDTQRGEFEVRGGAFAFKDPQAKSDYNTKRIWIAQRMDTWSGTPESARPLTVTQILKALGDGLPGVQ